MIHAYDEIYIPHVSRAVGCLFDIACNRAGLEIDEFSKIFSTSRVAMGICEGNPHYLAGMSGSEMARDILGVNPRSQGVIVPTEMFWCGYTATRLQ